MAYSNPGSQILSITGFIATKKTALQAYESSQVVDESLHISPSIRANRKLKKLYFTLCDVTLVYLTEPKVAGT
jgi:hypothetical protein